MPNLEDKIDKLALIINALDKKIDKMDGRIDKKFNEIDNKIKHIVIDRIDNIELEIKQFKDINNRINTNSNSIHSHSIQIGILWAAAASFALIIVSKVLG